MGLNFGKIHSTNIELCFFLDLPVEIIKEIIYYLSNKDKETLRTVCKTIESIVNTTICVHSPIMDDSSCEKLILSLNKFPVTKFNFELKFYTEHIAEIFLTLKTNEIYLHLLNMSNTPIKINKSVEKFTFHCYDDYGQIQWIELGENLKYLNLSGYKLTFDIIPTKNQVEILYLYFQKGPGKSFPKSFYNIFSQLKTINLCNAFIGMKDFIFPHLQNLELEDCCWEFRDFDFQLFCNIKKLSVTRCYSLNLDSSIKVWDFSKFFQLKTLKIWNINIKILLPPNIQHLRLYIWNQETLYTSKLSPLIESFLYTSLDESMPPIEFDQFPPNLKEIYADFISFDILKNIEIHYRVNCKRKLTLWLSIYHNFSNEQRLFCEENFIVIHGKRGDY